MVIMQQETWVQHAIYPLNLAAQLPKSPAALPACAQRTQRHWLCP